MKKEALINLFLFFMIFGGVWIGYVAGSYEKKTIYDNLTFLLESDRNMEAHENIKALEGLRENKSDIIIKFMQVRVKSALDNEGIKKSTIERAKKYQKQYCEDACLGVD